VTRTQRPIRRFYFELVGHRLAGGAERPAEVLLDERLAQALDALADEASSAGVELRLAPLVELRADETERTRDALHALRAALDARGVGLDVWPQVPDDETRFLNTTTVARVHAQLVTLLDALGDDPGIGLCLDVEPPAALMDGAAAIVLERAPLRAAANAARVGAAVVANVARGRAGSAAFAALGADLARRGLPVHVAVVPPFTEVARGAMFRRWLLGCPAVDDSGAPLLGRPAPMCYGSMLRLGRGRRRAAERATLRRWAGRHARYYGARGEPLAIALGLISRGVLRTEPVYDELSDLVEDVELACELGFTDLAFFSLEGLWWGAEGVPPDDRRPSRSDWRSWLGALL
jgi:hypothetical protein